MAELIPTNRATAVLGPIKMEIINIAGASVVVADAAGNPSSTTQTGVVDADTVKTLIQNPIFAIADITSDAVTITETVVATIVGKEITVNSTDLANDDIVLLVFGF